MNYFHYSGTDTLEVIAKAKKYNSFLEVLVLKYAPEDGFILDIGAGIGTFVQMLNAKGYSNILAIEPDVEQCTRLINSGLKAEISVENVSDNSVDFIYSLNVLEHIKNDKEVLQTWMAKLKPCGRIFVYVPAFNRLSSSFDKSIGHYRRYRKKTLARIFENTNFHIERIKYADSLGFFAALVYKWTNDGSGKINKKSLVIYDRLLFPLSRLIDHFVSNIFGKNVYVVARKLPDEAY
jgi:2-polyprenyl-3-methyl-5-hydroxy-6-metoxy-1,4-benzoquinol methylase